MKAPPSPAAQMFEKVLRAFETQGIDYAEVLARLRRLLATGADPSELLGILQRRDATERLPEHAQLEALLLEAAEQRALHPQASEQQAPQPQDPEQDPSEPDPAAQREAAGQRRQAERDLATIAEQLRAFEERIPAQAAALEALTRSYERAREAEAAAAQRATGYAAELERVHTALEAEQRRVRELELALAQSIAAGDTALAAARREARESQQAELTALRNAMTERDAAQERVRELEQAAPLPVTQPVQPTTVPAPSTALRGSEPRTRAPTSRVGRTLGWAAAAALLVGLVWFGVHRPSRSLPTATVVLPAPGTVSRDCPQCPDMTVLPTGRFKQGSASGSGFAQPVHWVQIERPFALSTNPVTVAEFGAFVAATGRELQGCDVFDGEWHDSSEASWKAPGFEQTGSHPVTCVSWNDAQAYAQWLSIKTGHRYRLPSASQWEYAAHAGSEKSTPWATDASACADADVADASAARRYPGLSVFPCDDGFVYTAPVRSFESNPWGLYDMLGNVLVWTEDCWHPNYVDAPIDGSAWRGGDCGDRELRGGSWFSAPPVVRADYRDRFPAAYRTSSVGIRLVRELGP